MNKTIHIREAVTPEEVERFWQELHAYHARDVFPDPAEEDRAYFLDDSQYRAAVQRIHDREGDRCYYLLFRREGRDIGFALTALYPSEDGKCFVMEFCVLQRSDVEIEEEVFREDIKPGCGWIGQRIGERSMGS